MKDNINKNYSNKANTIIINNNIQINTFIDKNNINLNQKGISVGNNNKNLFLYNNRSSEKNVKEIYNALILQINLKIYELNKKMKVI